MLFNLLNDIPQNLDEENFLELLKSEGLRVERIVSRGHSSPPSFWYDQPEAEWVLLLRGAAMLEFEGDDELLRLTPGDHVNIPPHRRHRVAWTAPDEPTVWLAIFYSRETDAALDTP
jgi:cupin 2 domain-containing protein